MATVVKCDKQTQKFNTAEDVADIVEAIHACESTLETINLQGNSYGVEASAAIGQALELCHQLKHLELDDMFISRLKTEIPQCLEMIFRGVINAGARIKTLNLNDNAIGPVTMPALLPFLESDSCSGLEVLKLNNCGLGIKGGQMLATVLASKHSLKEIIIGRNRLEIDGIAEISRSLSQISSLERLELPQNGTKYGGITALCEAIKANKNLRVLNVNDNVLRTTHKEFAEAVSTLDNLEVLNLGDCLLKTDGARSILQALVQVYQRNGDSTRLREVILNGNEIGKNVTSEVIQLGDLVRQKIIIDLNSNCLGADMCNELHEYFSGHELVTITTEEDEEEEAEEEEGEEDSEQTQEQEVEEILNVEELIETYQNQDTEALCETFFNITSTGLDSSMSLTPATLAKAEALIRVLSKRTDIVNPLLVSCGLIKGEDKQVKTRVNADLTGTLVGISKFFKILDSNSQSMIRMFVTKKIEDKNKYQNIRQVVMQNIFSF